MIARLSRLLFAVLTTALLSLFLGACAPDDGEPVEVEATEDQLEALPHAGNTPGDDGFSQETGESLDDAPPPADR